MKILTKPVRDLYPHIKKLTLIMRLSVLLILLAVFTSSASVYSQATRLTVKMKDAPLSKVFDAIEKQSEFYFFYNRDYFNDNRLVTVDFENELVEKILQELFKGEPIIYEIYDRNILLRIPESTLTAEQREVLQQQPAVSGRVTDESGQPLPGVTVVVKGTTRGTVTDADGEYNLINLPEDATLVFSFVGMLSKEIVVENQNLVNVQLITDLKSLEEIVVSAFGIEREKRSLGYSVGTISGDAMNEVESVNILNNLAGRVPGVSVRALGSDAGASVNVQIRGAKNFAPSGSQPLFIVDGVPIPGGINFSGASDKNVDWGNSTSDINAENIEKISILKGANAAAL